MTATAVIALLATQATGAAPGATGSADSRAQSVLTAARVSAPVLSGANRSARPRVCPSVLKALRYYTARYRRWTQMRGAVIHQMPAALTSCPRYLLAIRVRKAAAARRAWNRYFHYHYVWADWLPSKWRRIGACETGYGREPGNWRHSNSAYEGAFGFAKSSWDAFKGSADPKAGPYPDDAWQATPRQQYEVALAIWRRYGFSGWGCRGA